MEIEIGELVLTELDVYFHDGDIQSIPEHQIHLLQEAMNEVVSLSPISNLEQQSTLNLGVQTIMLNDMQRYSTKEKNKGWKINRDIVKELGNYLIG